MACSRLPALASTSIRVRTGGAVIEVADNGVGFNRDEVPDERLGLRVSIEERMANAGGSAEISSRPGHGTLVTVSWPDETEAEGIRA